MVLSVRVEPALGEISAEPPLELRSIVDDGRTCGAYLAIYQCGN